MACEGSRGTLLALMAVAALLPCAAAVPFRLASIFGNGMVLQRDAPVSIWGTATPGQVVYATLTSLSTNATFTSSGAVDAAGRWLVKLPPQSASSEWRLAVSDEPEADPAKCDQFGA